MSGLHGVKLGVDVGLVRVGLAASDPDGVLAMPVRTLKRDAKKNSDIRVVVREAAERGAVEVFVGLPRSLGGGETASTQMARDYAQALVRALADAGQEQQVRLVDERLTTVSAHRSLREAGMNSRNHRTVVDQAAAVAILQQSIDTQRSLNRDVGELVTLRRPRRESGGVPAPTEEFDISQDIEREGGNTP
ncbi:MULTISPECIES: Holliday junction resolvase RuvX [Arthrobacter]|uniref:Putative pre-16S rRNA nuclease n=1 Tax=Arthrobacter jinronghuae TaxID=2964609 RepID=A0ABT1NRX4_9MICC|nr:MULTISPECIES: Holliday junction resolvase RuvX [Arthrobacter]MCQ1950341.1 Holliday junction resolvase RuvX [Arthrobacter jinronghuae]MCQ1953259.1 Holliday junction resolvase RuvX [Arthrobacter sp. zg-Y238]MCQ1956503.1 Holliday junction resolvase RuvX [Arthrobacter jinronghuae]UWX77318.1 Holliday junction resolvase RuvX [Arthrobacter jinronghuae]